MNHNNVPMTEILPYLYLGNRSDANNVNSLAQNGIGFILNLTTSATEYPKETNIISRHINILDSVNQSLSDTYQRAFDFIDQAQKLNSKVLIHCEAGISRSPTITVAYLICSKKMDFPSAYNFVKRLRPIVSPNFGFMGQLVDLEKEIVPEKVAKREKEAKLLEQNLDSKLLVERSVVFNDNKLIENKPNENRLDNRLNLNLANLQTAKPVKPLTLNIQQPTNDHQSLAQKKLTIPKPLSLDLKTPIINTPSIDKYVLPSQDKLNDDQNLENRLILNRPTKLQLSKTQTPASVVLASTPTNQTKTKNNQHTSSNLNIPSTISPIKAVNKLTTNISLPKSTSQPQIANKTNNKATLKNIDKSKSVDSNNNSQTDKSISKIVNGKLVKNESAITKSEHTRSDDRLIRIQQASLTISIASSDNIANLPRSVPSSNATTPSNKPTSITFAGLFNTVKSVSQSSLLFGSGGSKNSSPTRQPSTTKHGNHTNRPNKPLRPCTLFLNANVSNKMKTNTVTPSSLCSPLNAFAVTSSVKSNPALNTLSSQFESTDKMMSKRRWFNESSCTDLTSDLLNNKKKKTNIFTTGSSELCTETY